MKRNVESKLLWWKNLKDKNPLLVIGVRDVGKTHTIFEFGKKNYKNIVYLDFETKIDYAELFEYNLDPNRIINELEALFKTQITEETLLFFDEITCSKRALTSLKYFCEIRPEINIIATSSLLSAATRMSGNSFPVGKVHFLKMYPMSFDEYLLAIGEEELMLEIKEHYETNVPLVSSRHLLALDHFRDYLSIGGYPSSVSAYINNSKSKEQSEIAKTRIMLSNESDMSRYCIRNESSKNVATYSSVYSQLCKDNKKFKFSLIKSGARAITYEDSFNRLVDSRLVIKVSKVRDVQLPLKFYEDIISYRAYLNDVGLLSQKSIVYPELGLSYNSMNGEMKGVILDNYVVQSLTINGFELYYWESDGDAKLDFLIQLHFKIVPIEIKEGRNTPSKSLTLFNKRYNNEYSIRISSSDMGFENNIRSIPFYAVWCIKM